MRRIFSPGVFTSQIPRESKASVDGEKRHFFVSPRTKMIRTFPRAHGLSQEDLTQQQQERSSFATNSCQRKSLLASLVLPHNKHHCRRHSFIPEQNPCFFGEVDLSFHTSCFPCIHTVQQHVASSHLLLDPLGSGDWLEQQSSGRSLCVCAEFHYQNHSRTNGY